VLPFLLLAVISNLAVGRGWLRSKRAIMVFTGFLLALQSMAIFGRDMKSLDTSGKQRGSDRQIPIRGVLTTHRIAPALLTHRCLDRSLMI